MPLSFAQLTTLSNFATECSLLDNEVLFAHLTPSNGLPVIHESVRIDGLMIVVGIAGELHLEIDLKECIIAPGTLTCLGLDNIVRIIPGASRDYDVYIMVISPSFMRDINIDLNVVNITSLAKAKRAKPLPIISLHSDEQQMLYGLLQTIHDYNSSKLITTYRRQIVMNLVASLLYHLMECGQRVSEAADADTDIPEDTPAVRPRRSLYLREFIALAQKYHRSQRSVAFYAEKLFISPKYLSLVIKETTGRSASQWIDDMVILEAKNLLRFSGKNIQQVAYELNFTNQSAFGKYFKHLTGLSPSQYQKQ